MQEALLKTITCFQPGLICIQCPTHVSANKMAKDMNDISNQLATLGYQFIIFSGALNFANIPEDDLGTLGLMRIKPTNEMPKTEQ